LQLQGYYLLRWNVLVAAISGRIGRTKAGIHDFEGNNWL
jgi:hypothetical protein